MVILPDGGYIATDDEFGPNSTEGIKATTKVFASSDRGKTWTNICRIDGQFWSTVFVHRSALYLIGTDRHLPDLSSLRPIPRRALTTAGKGQ